MTQLVTVRTDFRDLEQMAQGLAGRVHSTHVILPAEQAVEEGQWAQFEIALHDGHAGLAGIGRCVTVVDNGTERLSHQRFDVVLDSLQFDTHERSVFDHILAVHGAGGRSLEQLSDEEAESVPPTYSEDTGSFVDVSADFTGSQSVVPPGGDEERTLVAGDEELRAALSDSARGRPDEDEAPPPMAARNAGGSFGGARSGAVRAFHPQLVEESDEPRSGERIAPAGSLNGASFAYSNGIPFPSQPPRPALDPTLRVTPAPRPPGSQSHGV